MRSICGICQKLVVSVPERMVLPGDIPATGRTAPTRFRNRFRAGRHAGRERIHGVELDHVVRRGRRRFGLDRTVYPTGQAIDLRGWALTDTMTGSTSGYFRKKRWTPANTSSCSLPGRTGSREEASGTVSCGAATCFATSQAPNSPWPHWNEPGIRRKRMERGGQCARVRAGRCGRGYPDGGEHCNLLSLYARIEFTVDDPDDVLQAVLHMDYDDGFVAYLNGQEIARSFMSPGTPSFNTRRPACTRR